MHAGFSLLKTGSCGAMSASNVLMKTFVNVRTGTRGFFQWSFCPASVTIVNGAVAEHVLGLTHAVFAFVTWSLIYLGIDAWARGYGRLGNLFGAQVAVFAGSGLMLLAGGVGRLAGLSVLGWGPAEATSRCLDQESGRRAERGPRGHSDREPDQGADRKPDQRSGIQSNELPD